jgi:anti-anti-sigma regulatory factor
MAVSDNKNLMGYDPLACPGQETGNRVMEDVIMTAEVMEEQLVASDADINVDDPCSLSESANALEILEVDTSEIDMNTITDLPEDQILDEAATEDVAESMINLDATLTIQHVVKLHEKLKKSYAANNPIEINASQVKSIDTSTLQLLVALKKDAVKQQKEVIFVAPSLRFIESAELLGLLEILEINA